MPEPPIVAITHRDVLLHIAPAADVLAHIAAEGVLAAGDWDFFDNVGCPLTKVTDEKTGTVTLEQTHPGEKPTALALQTLADRISSFLARAQVLLDADLVVAEPGHVRVPRIEGDLPDVITALAAVMSLPVDPEAPDLRDWLHNLGHRLGLI